MRKSSLLVFVLSCIALTVNAAPQTTSCPAQFHTIKLHPDAKLCQLFDTTLPASMIYHVKESTDKAVAFFLTDNSLSLASTTHGRSLIVNNDKSYHIVVSPDGQGSQIDILVKSKAN